MLKTQKPKKVGQAELKMDTISVDKSINSSIGMRCIYPNSEGFTMIVSDDDWPTQIASAMTDMERFDYILEKGLLIVKRARPRDR